MDRKSGSIFDRWPATMSIRTMRGRTATLFSVILLAAGVLGASLLGGGSFGGPPLAWFALDVACVIVLIAAWAWADTEIVRPVNAVGEIALAFASGDENLRARDTKEENVTHTSPWQSVDTLAAVLNAQTGAAENALNVERALLREVNHRVRNNLQMVASVLAIQARADETQGAERAHDRIQLLSLAHDRIYASGDVHDVRLDDLAAEIGRTLLSSRGARARLVKLELALEPARTKNDLAVPMAFLMGESFAHALGLLESNQKTRLVMALLTEADGSIMFSLSSVNFPERRPLLPNVRRVMEAFALQLGADIMHGASGPELLRIRMPPGVRAGAA